MLLALFIFQLMSVVYTEEFLFREKTNLVKSIDVYLSNKGGGINVICNVQCYWPNTATIKLYKDNKEMSLNNQSLIPRFSVSGDTANKDNPCRSAYYHKISSETLNTEGTYKCEVDLGENQASVTKTLAPIPVANSQQAPQQSHSFNWTLFFCIFIVMLISEIGFFTYLYKSNICIRKEVVVYV